MMDNIQDSSTNSLEALLNLSYSIGRRENPEKYNLIIQEIGRRKAQSPRREDTSSKLEITPFMLIYLAACTSVAISTGKALVLIACCRRRI
jgi:hypothetical protein